MSMNYVIYNRCLGLKTRNHIAFSNRALSYLKLKEYSRAIVSAFYAYACMHVYHHYLHRDHYDHRHCPHGHVKHEYHHHHHHN